MSDFNTLNTTDWSHNSAATRNRVMRNTYWLLALSLLQGLCIRFFELKPRLAEIASGLIFGSVCIVGMMIPINLAPGVIVDGRSVVLSMAGLFGGPLTGVIAGVVAVNGLGGQDAGRFRRAAWAAVDGAVPFDDTTSSAVTDGGGTIDLRDGAREPHAPPEERAVEARHATPKLGVA